MGNAGRLAEPPFADETAPSRISALFPSRSCARPERHFMSKYDYKYYLCPKCGYCLDPQLAAFLCYNCGYEHPRERERELCDGMPESMKPPKWYDPSGWWLRWRSVLPRWRLARLRKNRSKGYGPSS